ncbi:MAG TPA: hypothetical protein ENH87_13065 [Pricia antarctica]|uniref:Mannosyltransferase related to Gpi18 n=2 Tax=root TaxID=1 RepID=A0A831QSC9_9FLAO|nr:hypothetical protein [Pricia antarctica]
MHWRPLPYLVALLFTIFILTLHMLPNMDSMLNENNTRISHGFLKSQIDYHQEIAPFARRPMTSYLIERSMDLFGFRPGHGFILINFTLLFLSGCLLFRLSKILKSTNRQAIANQCVYYASFSVLFAFFPPVFSYDEPLQYCFLLLAFSAFMQRRWVWYVPFFTLALVSRETSLLLIPGLLLHATLSNGNLSTVFSKQNWKTWLFIVLPIAFYGLYLFAFIYVFDQLEATRTEMASRYSCFIENFENLTNTVESWTSLYLALAPYLYLSIMYLKNYDSRLPQNKWVYSFLLTVAINSPIVIFTAFARETRLFALPLLFIWPIFAQVFWREVKLLTHVNLYQGILAKWILLLPFIGVNLINYWFCFHFYSDLGLGPNTYFSEYLFVMNFGISLHFLLFQVSKRIHIPSTTSSF